jgi:hypothetical protein
MLTFPELEGRTPGILPRHLVRIFLSESIERRDICCVR